MNDHIIARPHKRKILLATLYRNWNYGNVLQRYALTRTLENYGFEVTHLCDKSPASLAIINIKLVIKHVLALLGSEKYRRKLNCSKREIRFRHFQDKFTQRKIRAKYTDTPDMAAYDYALAGSDQVWHNWYSTPDELRYYYLEFADREKRVCYAPSFGFSKFSEQDIEIHRAGLMGFDRLSCREQEMQSLIRSLTGQEAELVLDPTLLLTHEQWRTASSRPKYKIPECYVLCYFLGEIPPEYSRAIHDMARGLPVINVFDINDSKHYATHPGEFVYLIDHADFVVTDSFHGVAFSVNMHKNFLAFRRKESGMEDMFGRIETILTNTGLMNHVYERGMMTRPDDVDYDFVDGKLSVMREKSLKYLRECLKV